MKTKVTLIVLAMSAVFNPAFAGERIADPAVVIAAPADEFSFSGQTILRSQYLGSDVGVPFYNKPVLQGNVTLAHSCGGFIDIWYSTGFDGESNDGWDDEIDYTLGYAFKVGNADLTVLASYYDCFGVGQGPDNDVVKFAFSIALQAFEVVGLEVTPSIGYGHYWIPDSDTTFEGGNVANVGLSCSVPLSESLSLELSPAILWHDGAFGFEAGTVLQLGLGLDWRVSDHFTINVIEVMCYLPIIDGDEEHTAFGFGLSYEF